MHEGYDPSWEESIKYVNTHYTPNTEGPNRSGYEFFGDINMRRFLFHASKELASYLEQENVSVLVLIDRSARPAYMGLMEYWRTIYPDKPMPNIYFVNPDGFYPTAEVPSFIVNEMVNINAEDGGDYHYPEELRTKGDVLDDFQANYPGLMRDKEKTVMLFDTCVHSGERAKEILDTFERAGFQDIRFGSVVEAEEDASIGCDFYITENLSAGCYPFSKDELVDKNLESVLSTPMDNESQQKRAIRLRKEIKRVMKDFLKEGRT